MMKKEQGLKVKPDCPKVNYSSDTFEVFLQEIREQVAEFNSTIGNPRGVWRNETTSFPPFPS